VVSGEAMINSVDPWQEDSKLIIVRARDWGPKRLLI
jgi:hypothetical protein